MAILHRSFPLLNILGLFYHSVFVYQVPIHPNILFSSLLLASLSQGIAEKSVLTIFSQSFI